MQSDIDHASATRRRYSAILVCMLAAGLGLTLFDGARSGPFTILMGALLIGLLAADRWLNARVRAHRIPTLTEVSPVQAPTWEQGSQEAQAGESAAGT